MSWTPSSHAGSEKILVQLDQDHPGFRDPVYRQRRNRIARLALDYQGGLVPDVSYTEEEHEVWSKVWKELVPLHEKWALRGFVAMHQRLNIDRTRIPQFSDINPSLWRAGGFQLSPVAGMVEIRHKLRFLADSICLCTQYVRHPSRPLYTPEPDVIHELIGHAASLTHPIIAELYRAFGRAVMTVDESRMVELERVYWWTMEFGALREDGQIKAIGAALLSSAKELSRFVDQAMLMPFDIEAMAQADFDPTAFQPKIFVADSWEVMYLRLSDWLDGLTAAHNPAHKPTHGSSEHRYLRILHDFSVSMLGARSIDELLWIVTSGVVARLGYEDCVIYLLDETRDVFVQRAAHGAKNPRHHLIKAEIEIPIGKGIVGDVALKMQGEIIPDVRKDSRYLIDDKARSSEMSVPIIHEGRVLGVLDSENSEADFFTQNDLEIFETLASMLAVRLVVESERHEQDARLRQAIQVAEEATRAKSIFLANISHEVRTPLVAILGLTEMVQGMVAGRAPREDIVEHLVVVHRSSKHLLSLLNQLLDLSSDEQDDLRLEPRRCSPSNLLEEVYALFHHKAEEKGLSLFVSTGDGLPQDIITDPTRLRQILVNLVDNAIKFTDSGSVKVHLSRADSRVLIEVSDTGCGIPASQIHRVFESFYQADATPTRQHAGVGLGLAISKRLARRLGGELTLSSKHGEGSKFTIFIPMEFPEQEIDELMPQDSGLASESLDAPAARRSLRLLVAEDNPDTRRLITFQMQDAGHEVFEVSDGRQALQAALRSLGKATEFDAILLDMQMPEMDGFEVARNLREAHYERPIIALTAHALPGYRDACLAAGCSDFFSKPFEWSELLGLLAAKAE